MSTLKVDTIASDTTPTVTISDGLTVSGVTTTTGDISIADTIVHTGDTNTKIRFPSADTITVETGGTERVRVASDGKVGVGTAAPGQKVHLTATSGDGYFRADTNVNGGLLLYVQGTQRSVFANDSAMGGTTTDTGIGAKGNLIFRTGTSSYDERLRISSGGAVGINTTASSYPFQVQTDGTSTTVGGNIVARFQSSGAAGRDATIQLSDNVSHSATISMLSSALIFANAGTERVRIASAGQIGIGGANYGTSGQVLTSGGSGSAVSWAAASGGPTHYTKFTNEPSQSGNVTLSNWDVFSPGLSPTINTAVSHSSGIFSFPVTGIWEVYANVLWSFDGGATEQRLEIHGTTDDGTNWDILTRQYQCWVNTNTTKYQSLPTPPLLLDITDTSNCKVKFKVAGGPAGAQTAGDDNEWYTGCHFIRWGDT